MSKSIYSLLRNTYASINKLDPNVYIKGNDLPRYIKENQYKISMEDEISIIDINLDIIYWNNRESLSISDLENLNEFMKKSSIEFIELDRNLDDIQTYSLDNNYNQYNKVNITVKNFIADIKNNESILIKLPKIDYYIEYQYELYDFYNNKTRKIENFASS